MKQDNTSTYLRSGGKADTRIPSAHPLQDRERKHQVTFRTDSGKVKPAPRSK